MAGRPVDHPAWGDPAFETQKQPTQKVRAGRVASAVGPRSKPIHMSKIERPAPGLWHVRRDVNSIGTYWMRSKPFLCCRVRQHRMGSRFRTTRTGSQPALPAAILDAPAITHGDPMPRRMTSIAFDFVGTRTAGAVLGARGVVLEEGP